MSYNKLLDESTWSDVNQDSKDLLEDYMLELEATGKSEKTRYQYFADIRGFLSWIQRNGKNKSILELKKRDFRNFFLKMSKQGTSNARINRLQSSIRNLLAYCEGDEDMYEDYEVNQMRNIHGVPKEAVRDVVFLDNDKITEILEYLMDKKEYQKALYISLSYDSAARRNEVHQIKKDGFLESNQTNQVIGKRGKKFNLIYFDRTKKIAELYFEQRGNDDIESLWVVGNGDKKRAASYEVLYTWAISIRPIIKELFDEDLMIASHSWRHIALENYSNGTHYVLKEMGKKELPIDVLKVIAHHSSIETTQSYLKNKDEELLAQAFDLN